MKIIMKKPSLAVLFLVASDINLLHTSAFEESNNDSLVQVKRISIEMKHSSDYDYVFFVIDSRHTHICNLFLILPFFFIDFKFCIAPSQILLGGE